LTPYVIWKEELMISKERMILDRDNFKNHVIRI
jgi:hypothetical protein